jgi:hypothetical protein
VVCYYDIFSRSLDIFADPVVIFSKEDLSLSVFPLNREIIEVPGKMHPFADIGIMLFYPAPINPFRNLALHFAPEIEKDLLYLQEIFVKKRGAERGVLLMIHL